MIRKSSLSLIKIVTSTIATSAIMAVTVLAASCSPSNDSDSSNSEIIISDQSPNNQDVDSNITDNHNLYVNATCEGSNLKYQWYQNKNDNNGWTPIKGATSNQYQIPKSEINAINLETTWHFKAEIYAENNLENKVTSNVYSINIKPKKADLPLTPIEPGIPTPKPDPKPETPPSNDSDESETNEVPSSLNFNYNEINNSVPSLVSELDFSYKENIKNKYNRSANKEIYKTELLNKYENNGFKYPSYDYNYETGSNRYLNINSESKINMMDLVYKERTKLKNGQEVKYSDVNFINEQISNNELKVHPAAKKWYSQSITDETKAIEKWFSIGTNKSMCIPLGLYAAPGEIITLEFDDDTFNLIKDNKYNNLKIVINDNYWDNYPENNNGRISNRYPFVQTSFGINYNNKSIKFGSPFGGNISLYIPSPLKDYSSSTNSSLIKPIKFTVKDAIESLNYVHGYTTKNDWDLQVKGVIEGTITSPNMSALYSWGSMNIPFTDKKIVAGKKVENIVFPYEVFNKWNSFQFYSAYISRNYSKVTNFKFCDDIWSGGLAFGINNIVYAPISWAAQSFLSGIGGFTIKNSWGLMHEINHSYEQNVALFKKRGHGETNQITIACLAMLSDTGLSRSLNNIYQENANSNSPGWTFTSNSFSNIEYINKNSTTNEYAVYTAILYAIGARNYMDYIRHDVSYHPNTIPNWTGMKEIKFLSDYFKIDFWPAFKSIHPKWNDNWPSSYQNASAENQNIINSLKQYSAIDFVGNLYAAGNYIYNNGQYIYTGDVNTPIEAPIYSDYTFDFEKCINSVNKNFKWSKISVDGVSKNGVPLKVKDKSVFYEGSKNNSSELTDEFNITIIPDKWDEQPENYVPGYKWKIKLINSMNNPYVDLYTGITNWNIDSNNHADEVKKYKLENSYIAKTFDTQISHNSKPLGKLTRIRFSFIAPSAGKYEFNSLWNEEISIYANNQKVYSGKNKNLGNDNVEVYSLELKKNEVVDMDFFVYSYNSSCTFKLSITSNGNTINQSSSLLSYGMSKISNANSNKYSYSDYLTDELFKYKRRYGNYLEYYQNNLNNNIDNFVNPSKDLFTLSSSVSKIDNLYNSSTNTESWSSSAPAKFSFDVTFNSPTKVGSIKFNNRMDTHAGAKATKIKVIGIDETNNSSVLYDGQYGSWYATRIDWHTIISFDSVKTIKKMKVELTNEVDRAISLRFFTYSPDIYSPLNNNISIRNNYIAKTKGWSYINNFNNEYNTISEYDNNSLLTKTINAAIDFNLKNARGFRLMGTSTSADSIFDVYINGKIYKRNVKINSSKNIENNIELFKYLDVKEQNNLRVTIVNKSNNPLIINYIQTYGGLGPVMTVPFNKVN